LMVMMGSSESLGPDQGINEIDEQADRHGPPEGVIKNHVTILTDDRRPSCTRRQ